MLLTIYRKKTKTKHEKKKKKSWEREENEHVYFRVYIVGGKTFVKFELSRFNKQSAFDRNQDR